MYDNNSLSWLQSSMCGWRLICVGVSDTVYHPGCSESGCGRGMQTLLLLQRGGWGLVRARSKNDIWFWMFKSLDPCLCLMAVNLTGLKIEARTEQRHFKTFSIKIHVVGGGGLNYLTFKTFCPQHWELYILRHRHRSCSFSLLHAERFT